MLMMMVNDGNKETEILGKYYLLILTTKYNIMISIM